MLCYGHKWGTTHIWFPQLQEGDVAYQQYILHYKAVRFISKLVVSNICLHRHLLSSSGNLKLHIDVDVNLSTSI